MARTSYFIAFLITILFSCGVNKGNKDKQEKVGNLTETPDSGGAFEAKDCGEFIEEYKEWMDKYVKLIDKYMKNPMDLALSQEYMELAQEGVDWSDKWQNKYMHCATKNKYKKRFEKISERAEEKLRKMGLE